MTDLRKAAEMALEALVDFGWHIENCPQFPTWAEPKKHPPCTCGYDTTITALRQALERPQTPNDLLRQSEREGWRYAKECEAEVKRLRKARELLAWCAVEMHYAGWETRVPDNHGRADVLEAVEEYLK